MKILLVGSGGREHAICWKISQNPEGRKSICAPGNGGTAMIPKGENVNIKGIDELIRVCIKRKNRFNSRWK